MVNKINNVEDNNSANKGESKILQNRRSAIIEGAIH